MIRWLYLLYLVLSPNLSGLVNGQAQVQLGDTTLTGLSLPEIGLEFFGGIPYAEPPVASLRFAPPVLKLNPGVSSLNTSQFGFACPQFTIPGSIQTPSDSIASSEDCLTINVLRPAGLNESSSLPVMFWIYGGGFIEGASSIYNGSAIVARSISRGTPVIFVSFNYRVGPIGFPQGKEAEELGATNLGTKDVIAALKWVQSNIGVFGGDKDKVTMFGESAGSITVAQLLLNTTFDLARAGIMESGSPASLPLKRASYHETEWQNFVSAVPECKNTSSSSTFDCLRSASLESITNAVILTIGDRNDTYLYAPVIDGEGGIVPDLPSRLYARGEFARIPFIAGTNLDEATLLIPHFFNSTDQIRQWLLSNTTPPVVSTDKQSSVIDTILQLYPDDPTVGSPFGTGNETFGLAPEFKQAAAIYTDFMFAAGRRQFAQVAAQQGVKVFAYLFTEPQGSSFEAYAGVPHGSEIPYVFGFLGSDTLSLNIRDYWVSFATSLDPNDGQGNSSRTLWEQYTPDAEVVMQLETTNLTMIPDTFRAKQIAFMNNNSEALRR